MYKKLKIYLKENLNMASLEFKWSAQDNKEIFSFLNERFPDREMQETERVLRQVLYEYVEHVGYMLCLMNKT